MKKNHLLLLLSVFCFEKIFSQQTGSFTKSITIQGSATTVTYYVPASYTAAKSYKLILNLETASQGHYTGYADTANAIVVATSKIVFSEIRDIIDSTKQWYNVGYDKIYLTGFSIKGWYTLTIGLSNPTYFKGLIPLAPASTTGITYSNSNQIPTCIVTGSGDSFLSTTHTIYNAIVTAGGLVDSAIVQGIGHTPTGPDARTQRIAECFNYINANATTSVHDIGIKNMLLDVFPNPASENLYIKYKGQNKAGSLSLYDINGRLIMNFQNEPAQNEWKLPVYDFSPGIYFLIVETEKQRETKKIIVENYK